MAYSLPLFFPAQYTRLAGPKAPGDSVPRLPPCPKVVDKPATVSGFDMCSGYLNSGPQACSKCLTPRAISPALICASTMLVI